MSHEQKHFFFSITFRRRSGIFLEDDFQVIELYLNQNCEKYMISYESGGEAEPNHLQIFAQFEKLKRPCHLKESLMRLINQTGWDKNDRKHTIKVSGYSKNQERLYIIGYVQKEKFTQYSTRMTDNEMEEGIKEYQIQEGVKESGKKLKSMDAIMDAYSDWIIEKNEEIDWRSQEENLPIDPIHANEQSFADFCVEFGLQRTVKFSMWCKIASGNLGAKLLSFCDFRSRKK